MRKEIQLNNTTLYYTVIGAGEPVMLLHGFGEDSTVWDKQIDFLKPTCQLIIPDLPGSGFSKVADWKTTMGSELLTVEWMASLVKLILDEERVNTCAMIGHSMGGYITLAFAEKYPDRLIKLGLFHSTAFADNDEKKQTRRRGIEFIKNHGAYAFLKQSTPNLFAEKYTSEHLPSIQALIESGRNFTPEALVQYYEAMIARPDRTAILKNFPGTVLFIIGKYDKAVPYADSLQQCHLPLISHIHILEHTAHMGMWEEEDKSSRALYRFITS